MDEDLVYTDLGDENFLHQANAWKPDEHAPVRERVEARFQRLRGIPDRRPNGSKSTPGSGAETAATASGATSTDSDRWDKVRKAFVADSRVMGDLEASTGMEWDCSRRRDKVADFAPLSWRRLKSLGLSTAKRQALLQLFETALQLA